MALNLNKPTQYGVDTTYHKIISITIDLLGKTSSVTLASYKDQAARVAKAVPLTMTLFNWDGVDFPFEIGVLDESNPVTIAYDKIKALDDWKDAQNI